MTKLAIIIQFNDSSGYNEVDDYFATEAGTMINIVCEVDLNKD